MRRMQEEILVFFTTCLIVYTCIDSHVHADINECDSKPCQNGGTCVDKIAGYSCECSPGAMGTHCETDINECSSIPCLNGGSCVDGVNGYFCMCPAEYSGSKCQSGTTQRPFEADTNTGKKPIPDYAYGIILSLVGVVVFVIVIVATRLKDKGGDDEEEEQELNSFSASHSTPSKRVWTESKEKNDAQLPQGRSPSLVLSLSRWESEGVQERNEAIDRRNSTNPKERSSSRWYSRKESLDSDSDKPVEKHKEFDKLNSMNPEEISQQIENLRRASQWSEKPNENTSKDTEMKGCQQQGTSKDTETEGCQQQSTSKDTETEECQQQSIIKDTETEGCQQQSTSKDTETEGCQQQSTSKDTETEGCQQQSTSKDTETEGCQQQSTTKDTETEGCQQQSTSKVEPPPVLDNVSNDNVKALESDLKACQRRISQLEESKQSSDENQVITNSAKLIFPYPEISDINTVSDVILQDAKAKSSSAIPHPMRVSRHKDFDKLNSMNPEEISPQVENLRRASRWAEKPNEKNEAIDRRNSTNPKERSPSRWYSRKESLDSDSFKPVEKNVDHDRRNSTHIEETSSKASSRVSLWSEKHTHKNKDDDRRISTTPEESSSPVQHSRRISGWSENPNEKNEAEAVDRDNSTKPEETSPSKPEETSPSKIEETSPSKPEETSPSKPEETSPSKPEETSASKPKELSPSKQTLRKVSWKDIPDDEK